ncbi:MAG: isoprenoid biosynthesis glyoxalase ElbB [Bacteroidales bacterium]|jgi:enhancing lycopene biosynthesis protein 2|nr:isoprenoid biosynthesis glyoxalase ElbB [Bacteroidales bacterium]
MKKVAVVLSGNGVFDGSEIHEATLTLYAIVKNGGIYEIFAPDIDQHHVINHITGEPMPEKRNVLVESSRIARGKIKNLADFKATDFDALIFPGGFGVAKNLCTYAFDGLNCKVNKDVEKAIVSMHSAKKPIGALCISPVLLAKVLGAINITIGMDKNTAGDIKNLGAMHTETNHGEIVIDKKNKIVTTPCYMLNATIAQIGDGANNLVKAVFDFV